MQAQRQKPREDTARWQPPASQGEKAPGDAHPAVTLTSDLQPPELQQKELLLSEPPSLRCFATTARANEYVRVRRQKTGALWPCSSPQLHRGPTVPAARHQMVSQETRADQLNNKLAIIQPTAQTPARGSSSANLPNHDEMRDVDVSQKCHDK